MTNNSIRRARVIGKKVFLRPMEREDINDEYLDWVNDTSLNTYILQSGYPVNMDSAMNYFERSQPPSAVFFAICDIETRTHIGNARLSLIDPIHRVATYGRIIGHKEFLGRGFGSDALIQLLRFGFHKLGLNRIWSSAVTDNHASLGSNDRVGMVREGILREYVYADGRFHDTVVLAMLRSDFDKLHGDPNFWKQHDVEMRAKIAEAS